MLVRFSHTIAILFLALFCYGLRAQTTADSPMFSFTAPQKVLTGAASHAGNAITATAVDVNGDGNMDFIVRVLGSAVENYLLIGDGKGGFILKKSNVPSLGVTAIENLNSPWTFVDVNRDGYPDSVTYDGGSYVFDPQNGCEYDQTQNGRIYVSLNNGQGNFTLNSAATIQMEPATEISAVIGDFNNDGLNDVALLTNDSQECAPNQSFLYVLLNNGDGTFTSEGGLDGVPIAVYGTSLVAGDFNGDGKLDLAFLGQAGTLPLNTYSPIQVLYGNGDGSFKTGPVYKVNISAYNTYARVDSILAADLNSDGKTDLVILLVTNTNTPTPQRKIVTLLAKQSGGFYWYSEIAAPVSQEIGLIGLMDLNNDGKLDLPYYSFDTSTKVTSLRVYPGLGEGKFGPSWLIRNLAPDWENDIFAPLKTGDPLDIFYALSYPPNKNVYLYEMLNQSK